MPPIPFYTEITTSHHTFYGPLGGEIDMEIKPTPIKSGSKISGGKGLGSDKYVNYECETWTTWDVCGERTHFRITSVPYCMEDVVGVFYD